MLNGTGTSCVCAKFHKNQFTTRFETNGDKLNKTFWNNQCLSSLQTNSCPFCRHELPTDDEAYEAFKKDKKRKEGRKEDIEALHNSMFS